MRNPFIRNDSGSSSFLPADYVTRKAELRANLLCLSLFGVVMFGVVAAFFVTNRQWLQVKREQQSITQQYTKEQAKIEQLKLLEKQKSEMLEKAEITTALIEKVPRATLVAELVTRMPEDITLLEMQLTGKRLKEPAAGAGADGKPGPAIKSITPAPGAQAAGPKKAAPGTKDPKAPPEKPQAPKFEYTLRLTGVAQQNNNIADYIQSLKTCTLLENVDVKYIKETTIDKLDLRKFEIEATIRRNADGRGIAPVKDLQAQGVPGSSPTRPTTTTPDKKSPLASEGGKKPGEE